MKALTDTGAFAYCSFAELFTAVAARLAFQELHLLTIKNHYLYHDETHEEIVRTYQEVCTWVEHLRRQTITLLSANDRNLQGNAATKAELINIYERAVRITWDVTNKAVAWNSNYQALRALGLHQSFGNPRQLNLNYVWCALFVWCVPLAWCVPCSRVCFPRDYIFDIFD